MKRIATLTTIIMLTGSQAYAEEQTTAMYSPKCDLEKVQELLKDIASKVEKGAYDGGYNVTIDTDKSQDAVKILNDNGCIQ